MVVKNRVNNTLVRGSVLTGCHQRINSGSEHGWSTTLVLEATVKIQPIRSSVLHFRQLGERLEQAGGSG